MKMNSIVLFVMKAIKSSGNNIIFKSLFTFDLVNRLFDFIDSVICELSAQIMRIILNIQTIWSKIKLK